MAEVALAVVLVIGAGLLLRSFWNLMSVDAGFNRSALVTFGVVLPGVDLPVSRRAALISSPGSPRAVRTERRSGSRGDVRPSAGAPRRMQTIRISKATSPPKEGPFENVDYYQTVTLDYLKTMGIPLVDGRDFTLADVDRRAGGARQRDAGEDVLSRIRVPIGRRLKPGFRDQTPWFTIVGVVRDVKQGGVSAKTGTELYFLNAQGPRRCSPPRAT